MEQNISEKFNRWMSSTARAAAHLCTGGMLYDGKDGCHRFARECGAALPDFGDYGVNNIGATYGAICVVAYNLRPPVDASDWLEWMREGLRDAQLCRNLRARECEAATGILRRFDVVSFSSRFYYQFLDRLRSDCGYYLGNGGRYAPHLWTGEERSHIELMRAVYAILPEKPEWLTAEQIDNFAKEMGVE